MQQPTTAAVYTDVTQVAERSQHSRIPVEWESNRTGIEVKLQSYNSRVEVNS